MGKQPIRVKTIVKRITPTAQSGHKRTLVKKTVIKYYIPSKNKPKNTYLNDIFLNIPVHESIHSCTYWDW